MRHKHNKLSFKGKGKQNEKSKKKERKKNKTEGTKLNRHQRSKGQIDGAAVFQQTKKSKEATN